MTTYTAPATHPLTVVRDAERRMYDAELALHAARQSGVDSWVAAAYEKLHAAIGDHAEACRYALRRCA